MNMFSKHDYQDACIEENAMKLNVSDYIIVLLSLQI